MRKIYQLVHTLSYGDATSGGVLAMKHAFQELGFESEVFAIGIHEKYKGFAKHYSEFPKDFNGEVLLQYSIGSPLNDLFKSLTSAKRYIYYHNITPEHWFEGVNPRVQNDIIEGRKQLKEICEVCDKIVSVSKFNAKEIEDLGFKSEVLPLLIDPKRWENPGNEGIKNILKSNGCKNFVHVGRIAPNKCIEDILKIFYFYHHHINTTSKLWIIGIDIDTEIYSLSLKRMVEEIKLQDAVEFVGGRSDEEVRGFYESADLYISMSEHEGFCMPVVEAMNFEVPVIAADFGALSETIGDGGIIVAKKKHAELAELVHQVLTDSRLNSRLKEKGKQRAASFTYEKFKSNIQKIWT